MVSIPVSPSMLWGIISIIFGLLVLAFPKILNYIVAFYLILIGILMVAAAL
jgi:uncharacterized membrane protein HdeD (DUF308 family)